MIKLIEIISKPNPVTAAELDQLRRFQLIFLASLPEEQQAASTEDFLRKWEAFQIQYNVKIPGSIEVRVSAPVCAIERSNYCSAYSLLVFLELLYAGVYVRACGCF